MLETVSPMQLAMKNARAAMDNYPHESSKDLIGCCRPMTDVLYSGTSTRLSLARRGMDEAGDQVEILTRELPEWEYCPWCGEQLGTQPLLPTTKP